MPRRVLGHAAALTEGPPPVRPARASASVRQGSETAARGGAPWPAEPWGSPAYLAHGATGRSDPGRQDVTAVHVRKARRRSVCVLCHSAILVGQQITDGNGQGWSHTRCLIAERSHMKAVGTQQYSYGEVGHDPPVHAVAGPWQGPAVTSRADAANVSLCGRKLSRIRKNSPALHDLCRRCEELMVHNVPAPAATAGPAAAPPFPENSAVQDYEVMTVGLGRLFVDSTPGLQRPEQTAWSKKLAATFSWARFNENPPKVSARTGGRFHIMDGQHEVAAAVLAGYPLHTPARVHVWRNLSYQQEAEMFSHNRDRHAVRALDLFIADVTAQQPDAVAIDVLLNTYKWRAGSAGREGNFAAITTIRRLYGKANGPGLCEKILATITNAWGHNPDGANQVVVSALGAFYQKYPEAEVTRMAQVLGRGMPAPTEMHPWAHEQHWRAVAVVKLQQRYDNGLRDPSRRLEQPQ